MEINKNQREEMMNKAIKKVNSGIFFLDEVNTSPTAASLTEKERLGIFDSIDGKIDNHKLPQSAIVISAEIPHRLNLSDLYVGVPAKDTDTIVFEDEVCIGPLAQAMDAYRNDIFSGVEGMLNKGEFNTPREVILMHEHLHFQLKEKDVDRQRKMEISQKGWKNKNHPAFKKR